MAIQINTTIKKFDNGFVSNEQTIINSVFDDNQNIKSIKNIEVEIDNSDIASYDKLLLDLIGETNFNEVTLLYISCKAKKDSILDKNESVSFNLDIDGMNIKCSQFMLIDSQIDDIDSINISDLDTLDEKNAVLTIIVGKS